MRIWFKLVENMRLLRDETIEDNRQETRTHKIMDALEKACDMFDIAKPIWLEANEKEFIKRAKTRFTKDNFIEEISFDYFEIHVLEEDG